MNEEVKNCPKCGGPMEEGKRLTWLARGIWAEAVTFAKKSDLVGDKILPFYCKNCGYIELYKAPTSVTFMKNCVKCGKKIPKASEECQHCGAKQLDWRNHEEPKRKQLE